MIEEFIPYNEAVALKEIGFNEPCIGAYLPPWTIGEEYFLEQNPFADDGIRMAYHNREIGSCNQLLKELFFEYVPKENKTDFLIWFNFNINHEFKDAEGYNYEEICSAPLYQQAFKWFRDKKGLHSFIAFTSASNVFECGYLIMIDIMKPHKALDNDDIYIKLILKQN